MIWGADREHILQAYRSGTDFQMPIKAKVLHDTTHSIFYEPKAKEKRIHSH